MKKKLITTTIIIFIALGTLSFTGTALGERISFEKLPQGVQKFIGGVIALNPAGPGEAPQYYDLLIKKTTTGEGKGAYQAGDIIAARPTTAKWSKSERQNFWIVKMYLAPSQAKELVKPKTKPTESEQPPEEQEPETLKRRKYYIPVENLEKVENEELVKKEIIRSK